MADTPEEPGLPPSLRFLKALVIILMITMIGGVITVVGLLVTRLPTAGAQAPTLPSELALPAGVSAQAVTFGTGWTAVVTTDNRILVFGKDGKMWQEISIVAPETE
jgi:Flp pilus assembly protein protease CpaA